MSTGRYTYSVYDSVDFVHGMTFAQSSRPFLSRQLRICFIRLDG